MTDIATYHLSSCDDTDSSWPMATIIQSEAVSVVNWPIRGQGGSESTPISHHDPVNTFHIDDTPMTLTDHSQVTCDENQFPEFIIQIDWTCFVWLSHFNQKTQ